MRLHQALALIALAFVVGASVGTLGAQYATKIYTEQGGEKRVYTSGAELEMRSGSTLDVQAGVTTTLAGTNAISGATTVTGATTFSTGSSPTIASGVTALLASGATNNVSGTSNDWGTRTGKLDGVTAIETGHKVTLPLVTKAANYTVLAKDSGTTFIATAADVEFTLPATAAGLRFTFVFKVPSGGTGGQVSPVAADKIMGDGFTSADDKAAINTGATDREGDSITIIADGVDGWFIVNKSGTFAREG